MSSLAHMKKQKATEESPPPPTHQSWNIQWTQRVRSWAWWHRTVTSATLEAEASSGQSEVQSGFKAILGSLVRFYLEIKGVNSSVVEYLACMCRVLRSTPSVCGEEWGVNSAGENWEGSLRGEYTG